MKNAYDCTEASLWIDLDVLKPEVESIEGLKSSRFAEKRVKGSNHAVSWHLCRQDYPRVAVIRRDVNRVYSQYDDSSLTVL